MNIKITTLNININVQLLKFNSVDLWVTGEHTFFDDPIQIIFMNKNFIKFGGVVNNGIPILIFVVLRMTL